MPARKRTPKTAEVGKEPGAALTPLEVILLGAALVLLLYFIYAIQAVVTPFIILGAILFLLYPLRSRPLARNVMWLAVVLFAFWFLWSVQTILAPFIVALIAAYVLHPLVSWLESKGIARWISSLAIIVCFIALLTVIVFLVMPVAFAQFDGMIVALNSIASQLTQWFLDGRVVALLRRYGISTEQLQQTITGSFAPRLENIMRGLLEGAFGLVSGLSTVISRIINMVIIPFLTFYALKDFPLIKHRAKMLIPRSKRSAAQEYYSRIDALLGRYIRGAITVAIINATAVAVSFWIFGIQYPLVMGVVAGVLDLIPYFGLLIMLTLSIIVAFFSGDPVMAHVILAASTIGVLHVLEAAVLSPKIIGSQVGIHPVLLILSLFVFSFFLGFIGLLIAVPTTAVLILVAREVESRSKAFRTVADGAEDERGNGGKA